MEFNETFLWYENYTGLATQPMYRKATKNYVNLATSSVFLFISIICNSLIVSTVARRPNLQQLPYIFLACIGICDITSNLGYLLLFSLAYFEAHRVSCKFVGVLLLHPEMLKVLLFIGIAVYKVSDKSALMGRKKVAKSVFVIAFLALISAAFCIHPLVLYYNYIPGGYCYYPFHVFDLYAMLKLIFIFVISTIIVLICLFASRKRRRDEVAEVDDEGSIIRKPGKADKRFEVMIIIAWSVFTITLFLQEILKQIILPVARIYLRRYELQRTESIVRSIIPFVFYPETFYKFFLYRSKDFQFEKEYKCLLKKNAN